MNFGGTRVTTAGGGADKIFQTLYISKLLCCKLRISVGEEKVGQRTSRVLDRWKRNSLYTK